MNNPTEFEGLLIERDEDTGRQSASWTTLKSDLLPEHGVTVKVAYSSLNYKDALAVTGAGKIIRRFPFVPGIDLAGVVVASDSPLHQPGDPVILTGYGVGESTWGGYAQLVRVKPEWLIPLPRGMTLETAMAIGTAGYTAMLCVMELKRQLPPDSELPVLVTGATGGVGSFAVALLHAAGFRVAAATGRSEHAAYLRELGADLIVERQSLEGTGKPLDSQLYRGAVDTVGGPILGRLLSHIEYGGTVAACGLAAGAELPATVFPFILRGVRLSGIDSVQTPRTDRLTAWSKLAELLPQLPLDQIVTTLPIQEAPAAGRDLLDGKLRGRIVFRIPQA